MSAFSLVGYAVGLRANNSIAVISLALLVYDYALTFADEVKYVWFAPWNVGKLLFCLTRYLPFTDVPIALYHLFVFSPSSRTCLVTYSWSGVSFTIGICVAQVILAMRTWAIWNNSKRWAAALTVILLCVWIPIAAILIFWLTSLRFSPAPDPAVPGCFVVAASTALSYNWLLTMLYESFVVSVTALKGLQYYRSKRTDLMNILYKDALGFSTCLFAISLANAVVVLAAPAQFESLFSAFQRVLHSIFTARILLHLRSAANKPPMDSMFEPSTIELNDIDTSGHSATTLVAC